MRIQEPRKIVFFFCVDVENSLIIKLEQIVTTGFFTGNEKKYNCVQYIIALLNRIRPVKKSSRHRYWYCVSENVVESLILTQHLFFVP